MRVLCIALVLAACLGPNGPEGAHVRDLELWACDMSSGACQRAGHLPRPPRDGTPFMLTARANGALLMQQELFWPEPGAGTVSLGWMTKADSVMAVWQFVCSDCAWAYWRVTLPWTGDRVLDADSLVWRW